MLSLCGCGSISPESAATTPIQETYYAQWPDGNDCLTTTSSATMIDNSVFAICDGTRLVKTDIYGTQLDELPLSIESGQSLSCICSFDEKLALIRVTATENDSYVTELLLLEQNGTLLSQDVLPIDSYPLGIAPAAQGSCLIGCENQMVYQINKNLEITAEISCENLVQILPVNDQTFLLQVSPETPDACAATSLSLWQDGSISPVCTLDAAYTGVATQDGYIFLSGTDDFWAVSIANREVNQLLTWESLGLNGAMQIPIAGVSAHQMLFSSTTLSDSRLLLLTTTAPEPDEHTVTLTLAYWALTAADQMAIQNFNRSQNDYQIETICYYPEDGDITAALTKMNADLLTSNAPDLYALNGMDVDVLQNQGLLLDLLPLMQQDESFSQSDYYTNIWELFQVNGQLYEFVPSFSLAGLAGTQEFLGDRTGWTISEFEAFAQMHANTCPIDYSSSSDFLYNCIRYGGHSFVDTDNFTCSFDTTAMENLLSVSSLLPASGGQTGLLYESWMSGIFSYQQMLTEVGRELRFVGYPSESSNGPAVNAFYTYGISSSTQSPEGAWAFLKCLLRDNQQNFYLSDGFPIKKSITESAFQRATLPFTDQNSLFYGNEGEPLSDTEIAYVQQLIEKASQRYLRYQQILAIVDEESPSYFSGDKTAEEVSTIIQNRVSIYLSE